MSVFAVEATDNHARAGTLDTPHGKVRTPAFSPVATLGSVKALDPADLRSIGAGIVLANAYHLYLRPGLEVFEKLGGLHAFMGWTGPILTDSGGFQGFSLGHLREITDDAIVFRSHIDGTIHRFSPETAIRCQEILGADIINAIGRLRLLRLRQIRCRGGRGTHRPLGRPLPSGSFALRPDPVWYLAGGRFQDLRQRSAEFLKSLEFQGTPWAA